MIVANPVCIYSTSLYKAWIAVRWSVFYSNFDIKMNVEMFPKI